MQIDIHNQIIRLGDLMGPVAIAIAISIAGPKFVSGIVTVVSWCVIVVINTNHLQRPSYIQFLPCTYT